MKVLTRGLVALLRLMLAAMPFALLAMYCNRFGISFIDAVAEIGLTPIVLCLLWVSAAITLK